jgi:hypothetical protein
MFAQIRLVDARVAHLSPPALLTDYKEDEFRPHSGFGLLFRNLLVKEQKHGSVLVTSTAESLVISRQPF